MYCLLIDANAVRHGQSFDDFCSDCGYSNDSMEAERIFNACRDSWSMLCKLGVDFDQMGKLFENY